ncbi:unnamed protein product [Mytilus edulis]|uniref:Uncharacterized protein n=1 Tax=Mytilus edulis TaxID=6550 RepID=A0A8S3QNW3_MYTED|nr:unnamed protein product [Mytilus edulis]
MLTNRHIVREIQTPKTLELPVVEAYYKFKQEDYLRNKSFKNDIIQEISQLGADIDEFGRRLRINYIFCEDNEENEEEENKPLVRNKSDWIPKPTKDKDLEETIRTLKTNSLTSNKNVRDNLTRKEKTALQNLKSDKSIILKEADKGNVVVIKDREYYRDNILDMLLNFQKAISMVYQKLTKVRKFQMRYQNETVNTSNF